MAHFRNLGALWIACAACQGNTFTGAGGRHDGADARPTPGPVLSEPSANTPPDPQPPPVEGPPTRPTPPVVTDTTAQGLGPSVIDQVIAVLQTNPNVSILQPNDGQIIVGRNQAFHLGNGDMVATSCQEVLQREILGGGKFYFEFFVLDPDVSVEINMNVCGVDFEGSDVLSVQGVALRSAPQPIPLFATTATSGASHLDPGAYVVIVESLPNAASGNDLDDFAVGDLSVTVVDGAGTPKRIRPGRIGMLRAGP